MHRLPRALLACAALACATSVHAEADLKPWSRGKTPALVTSATDGAAFDLERLRGRVVVINFWATWCDPCREEMPSLQKLRERLRSQPFELVTVNFGEGREKIAAFLQRQKISLPVLLDQDKEIAKAWGAGGLPITFLVDVQGRVRYSAFGECDWNAGEALRTVQSLIAEAPRARL